jgi:hypothetical protein
VAIDQRGETGACIHAAVSKKIKILIKLKKQIKLVSFEFFF